MPGGWELIAILAVVVLLFGAKKLPEFSKSIGVSIKEFRKATEDDGDDVNESATDGKS